MKKDSDGAMFTEAISRSEKETLLFDMECKKCFSNRFRLRGEKEGGGGGERN